MLTKTILTGAAFAIALSLAPVADAALFDFGRNTTPTVDPQAVQDMENRLESLELTVSALMGQVNQLTAQVTQLQAQLGAVGVGQVPLALATPASPPALTIAPAPVATVAPLAPAAPGATTASAPKPGTTTTIQLPSLTPPSNLSGATVATTAVPSASSAPIGTGATLGSQPSLNGAPLDLSALAKTGGTAGPATTGALPAPVAGTPGLQVASLTPSGDPKGDFDKAYAFITAGRYDLAETSFRTYLTAYPKADQAGDAEYWLGQSFFVRGKYSDAAAAFRAGYQAYPKSGKAPDTLLALGQSLAGMGQRTEACQIYAAGLKQYPTMSASLKQRMLTEQASAAC